MNIIKRANLDINQIKKSAYNALAILHKVEEILISSSTVPNTLFHKNIEMIKSLISDKSSYFVEISNAMISEICFHPSIGEIKHIEEKKCEANELIAKNILRTSGLEKNFTELGGPISSQFEGEALKEETLASTKEYQELLSILENERQQFMESIEATTKLKVDLDTQVTKNASLIRENHNLNSKLMDLLLNIQEIEEKLQDSQDECQRFKEKFKNQGKLVLTLEESIKNHEKKIDEQKKELANIPMDFVPLVEKESLIKEIKELKLRYRTQEENLKASYNKVLDESDQAFKKKCEQFYSGKTLTFEQMANFIESERESWTKGHKALMSDLENKKAIIESLELDKEESRIANEAQETVRNENNRKMRDIINNLEKNMEQLSVSYQMLGAKYQYSKTELKNKDAKLKSYHDRLKNSEENLRIVTEECNHLRLTIEEMEKEQTDRRETFVKTTHARLEKKIIGGECQNARVLKLLTEAHDISNTEMNN